MNSRSIFSFRTLRPAAMLVSALMLAGLLPGIALAAVPTITPATGGSAISADKATTAPGSAQYTTLTGPTIVGTGVGTIGAGTLNLVISGGFTFQVGTGTVTPTGVGCSGLVLGTLGVTATTASVTTTGATTGDCSLVFSGLAVSPILGTPLSAAGVITASGLVAGAAGALVEVPGAAVLSYSVAPSVTAAAGVALAVSPTVLSADQFGNPRSGDSVTLSTVPSTSGFSCTINPKPTVGSGLADFSAQACTFTATGSYVIRATTGSAHVDSATVVVGPGTPVKLIFTAAPGPSTVTALSAQPVVAIADTYGNTVTTASATVGLTLLAPDLGGPGSLTGCTSLPTASGVATFTGCLLGTLGVGYRLTATDLSIGGAHPYTPATSARFDVRDQLVFTASPLLAVSNTAFSTFPVVAVRAGSTNTAANDATTVVTLSISGSTGSGLLVFTSPTSTTFTPSISNSFSVTATGTPVPVVSLASGSAPGVTFAPGTGSGTLTGIPTTPGTYPLIFVATSTAGTVYQSFALTVGATTSAALAFTSAATASLVSSVYGSLTLTASGPVIPTITLTSGSAPGVYFSPGTGTALLYGTPTIPGTYPFVFTATSTAGTVTQAFTLTVAVAPTVPTLSCTGGLTEVAVAGLATFTGCSIDKVGTYTLTASAAGLTSATSSNLVITAGAPAQLGFAASPASASSSAAFTNPVMVTVQDAAGNPVTTGTGSTSSVILALAANSNGGTLTCPAGLVMPAVGGVATFTGCSINNAGTYSLSAVSGFLGVALSPAFTVSAPAAGITLTASDMTATRGSVITWGSTVTLTATFASGGANRTLNIQASRDGLTWATITTPSLVTDTTGVATFAYRPATNDYYRAVFAGAPDLTAAMSPTVRTVVRQILVLRPTNQGKIKTISHGTSIIFTSTVRPARTDLVPAKVTYYLYRLVSGKWVAQGTRVITASSVGLALTTFKFSTKGSWMVRSAANATPYNANSIMSPMQQFLVK